jgi:hypothetical protein
LCFTPCQAAIEFDGVDDYIAGTSLINIADPRPITVSAWIRTNNTNKSIQSIFTNNTNTNNPTFYLDIKQNTGTIYNMRYYSTGYAITSNSFTLDTDWHHYIWASNIDNTIQYFRDGQAIGTTSYPINVSSGSGASIGAIQALIGSGFTFEGNFDDLRIYNRILSITEIEALYKSRSKRPSGSLANGLVAHYEMDDDAIGEVTAQAKDSSGNLNHGQFIGFDNLTTALSKDIPAQIGTGYSLEFDGVNDKITASNSPSLNNWNEQTITAWIKADSTALGADLRIIEKGANNEWTLTTNRNGFIGQVGLQVGSSVYRGVNTTTLSSDNQWHFVAGRISPTYFTELFVDNERGSIATTGSGSTKTGNISIGEFGGAPSNRFQGLIDEIRIYDRILTNGEISFLYNGSGLNPGTSNLQALWTFDDDSAVKDSSGNSNHGVGGDSLKYTEGVLRR